MCGRSPRPASRNSSKARCSCAMKWASTSPIDQVPTAPGSPSAASGTKSRNASTAAIPASSRRNISARVTTGTMSAILPFSWPGAGLFRHHELTIVVIGRSYRPRLARAVLSYTPPRAFARHRRFQPGHQSDGSSKPHSPYTSPDRLVPCSGARVARPSPALATPLHVDTTRAGLYPRASALHAQPRRTRTQRAMWVLLLCPYLPAERAGALLARARQRGQRGDSTLPQISGGCGDRLGVRFPHHYRILAADARSLVRSA